MQTVDPLMERIQEIGEAYVSSGSPAWSAPPAISCPDDLCERALSGIPSALKYVQLNMCIPGMAAVNIHVQGHPRPS